MSPARSPRAALSAAAAAFRRRAGTLTGDPGLVTL